eukprot:TRINITY_DN6092_c1_g1_i1.p1 TRINITY_DN6092_c1_g1~~TRINITY_DN6092_c1_g1_i1.p1  ORF type:complete len:142 (+),score=36.12 TRINITY_DN6092_c1_g1_i1:28-426(+)
MNAALKMQWCSCVLGDLCSEREGCQRFHLEDVCNEKIKLSAVENMEESLAEAFKEFVLMLVSECKEKDLAIFVGKLRGLCFQFPPSFSLERCIEAVASLTIDDLSFDLHKGLPCKRKATVQLILDFITHAML